MEFSKIFGIKKRDIVTVTGSGGKTSLIFKLAKELKIWGKVLVTTTTKISVPEINQYENLFLTEYKLEKYTNGKNFNIDILGLKIEEGKIHGISEKELEIFLNNSEKKYDYVLIEGDGAKRKLAKIWSGNEPVIPSCTTKIIGVGNIQAIGKKVLDVVHRFELIELERIFNEEDIIEYLSKPNFFGTEQFLTFENKNIEKFIYLNGIETLKDFNISLGIINNILKKTIATKIFMGSIEKSEIYQYRKLTAIILASGESKRMGENKLLIVDNNEFILEKIFKKIEKINFFEKLLIASLEVEKNLKKIKGDNFKNFRIIENKNYIKGQSESIKLGVLNSDIETDYMFFPGDQPFLKKETIIKLIYEYMKKRTKEVTLPIIKKNKIIRFSPVIFPNRLRNKILCLEGDIGGKIIMKTEKELNEIEFFNEEEFKDLDTPEDLKYLKKDIVIVRGGGDIASGTIQKLYNLNFNVLVLEIERPSFIRKTVSYGTAIYTKEFTLEDITSKFIGTSASDNILMDIEKTLIEKKIPIIVDSNLNILEKIKDSSKFRLLGIVDAILAKKNLGMNKDLAPITIGLGPGFIAGETVDIVIETMRGHDLGKLIFKGSSIPNTGVPGTILGIGRERVIYSNYSGKLEIVKDIGEIVEKNDTIAYILTEEGKKEVKADINGVIRGMITSGYNVKKNFKIADIDPRITEKKNCYTISDKARSIGGAVIEALFIELIKKKNRG